MDRPDFDAQGHFEAVIATGAVRDVLRDANAVDAEVKDLDGDMQMVCYENYSKFIRATEVTSLVKSSVDGLQPDLARLERSFAQISETSQKVEAAIQGRAREIEVLLQRQRRCRKLQTIFELPTTLQRCLDREAYDRACEAYCMCTPFLRQYKHINTFRAVLEASELQMGRIKTALEWRLRAPDLSSKDAMNSVTALLDLGESPTKVARDFLSGRGAAFRARTAACFAEDDTLDAEDFVVEACNRAAVQCVPEFVDAVDGFASLRDGRDLAADGVDPDAMLTDFATVATEGLCGSLAALAERRHPPPDALAAGVGAVRSSLERLRSRLPGVMDSIISEFLGRLVVDAVRSLFSSAGKGFVTELIALHSECRRLEAQRNAANPDAVAEAAARVEQAMARRAVEAAGACQSLFTLVDGERNARQRLVQALHDQLSSLGYTVSDICRAVIRQERRGSGGGLAQELEVLSSLEWNGLFALALMRIARRVDVEVLSKASAKAQEVIGGADAERPSEFGASGAAAKAAEATLAHFVAVCGHRLAHLMRGSLQRAGCSRALQAPSAPSSIVDDFFREFATFDAQLGCLLGEPRASSIAHRRGGRDYGMQKSSMELDLDRQWARKLQVFSPVSFMRSAAVSGILRVAFKALIEYVREETFTTFGLQQLQVDAELFGALSRDFVESEDATVLGGLLAEAVGSATNRCEAPELMGAAAVVAMCGEKRRALRLD